MTFKRETSDAIHRVSEKVHSKPPRSPALTPFQRAHTGTGKAGRLWGEKGERRLVASSAVPPSWALRAYISPCEKETRGGLRWGGEL